MTLSFRIEVNGSCGFKLGIQRGNKNFRLQTLNEFIQGIMLSVSLVLICAASKGSKVDVGTRGHMFRFLWFTFSALPNRIIQSDSEVLIKGLFSYWANQRLYCENTC